jgi:hypothetical protein
MRIIRVIRLIVLCNILIATSSVKTFAIAASVRGNVSTVHEASGIDFTGGSSYWTHNDGYGDNRLYKLSSTGALVRTLTVTNAVNYDWEDITSDKQKVNMYIGDFGNNHDDRINLRIYKIPYPSSVAGGTVTASVIKFSYPDQNRFPARWLNFDAESFFHHNGKLYIFTKADGNAIGYCKLYTVPDQPGNYVATFIDSFAISGRVTSADISPDGRKAVLISNTRIYIFENFTGTNIFHGQYSKLSIDGSWTQKEGVCFTSNSSITLIDEGRSNKLYTVNLANYLREADPGDEIAPTVTPVEELSLNVYPNPATDHVTIANSGNFEHAEIFLFNSGGKVISVYPFDKFDAELRIETGMLEAGIYFVQMIADNDRKSISRLVINH